MVFGDPGKVIAPVLRNDKGIHQYITMTFMGLLQIRKIADCACAGNAGNVFPPQRVSNADMHHGTCVTHVPWCMPGLLASGFFWSPWRGKRSRHSWRNPQFYVSGKRPIERQDISITMPLDCLFRSFRLTWKARWKTRIASPLGGESTGARWILQTHGLQLQCVSTSRCHLDSSIVRSYGWDWNKMARVL